MGPKKRQNRMVSRADNEGQSILFSGRCKTKSDIHRMWWRFVCLSSFVLRPVCATRCIKQSVQIYTQNCALTNKYCIGIKPVTDNSVHMEWVSYFFWTENSEVLRGNMFCVWLHFFSWTKNCVTYAN